MTNLSASTPTMIPGNKKHHKLYLLGLLILAFLLNLYFGSVSIPFLDILKVLSFQEPENAIWGKIVLDFRLSKATTCVLGGAALSISGLQMQTLFRNPLAGPDVLGLSSGASLAVSLVLMSGATGFTLFLNPGPLAVAIAASVGSLLVMLAVLGISNKVKSSTSLLIVGLMIGAATSSIVSVLQFMSGADQQQTFLIWTFGSVGGLNWHEISILAILLGLGTLGAVFSIKSLNAWLLGDHYATNLGINLKSAKLRIILTTCLMTGAVTAFCGPIAFVGIAVPHITKLFLNTSEHKILIPWVAIMGATLMLLCDIIAQLPGSAHVLPINAITALIGAPIVIWIILRGNKVIS